MARRKRRRAAGRGGDRGPAQGWWLGAREVMPARPVLKMERRKRRRAAGRGGDRGPARGWWLGAREVMPAQPVSPTSWEGLLSEAREKQVWERAPRVCQGGSERGLRRWQRAGRGGCPCRPVRRLVCWFFCLLPAVLWEERNEAG